MIYLRYFILALLCFLKGRPAGGHLCRGASRQEFLEPDEKRLEPEAYEINLAGLNGKFRKFILWVKRHACLRQRVKLQDFEKELRRAGQKSAFSKRKVYFLNQPRFNFCTQSLVFKPSKTLINQKRQFNSCTQGVFFYT